jgi:hypothetical protein
VGSSDYSPISYLVTASAEPWAPAPPTVVETGPDYVHLKWEVRAWFGCILKHVMNLNEDYGLRLPGGLSQRNNAYQPISGPPKGA